MIELNDEAVSAVRGADLEGWIRLGMQEDFGEAILPEVLGRFTRAHPKVRIEARVARNAELLERVEKNELDLALVWGDDALTTHNERGFQSEPIAVPPMCWIGSSTVPWSLEAGEPLPLVAFDRQCLFHSAAIAALDRMGIPWRVAFTSPSLSGLWAAAAAGLGLTVRTRYGLPSTIQPLEANALGLPELPSIPLALVHANVNAPPPVDRLAAIVLESVRRAPAVRESE
jgi:DNA-binding transcriptional LysR family regulator